MWKMTLLSQIFSGQICVRDVNGLETWLGLAPWVQAWISRLLGKDLCDTQALDTFCMDWREATEPPLSTELIIAGRDEATRHIAHYLQGLPSVSTNGSIPTLSVWAILAPWSSKKIWCSLILRVYLRHRSLNGDFTWRFLPHPSVNCQAHLNFALRWWITRYLV